VTAIMRFFSGNDRPAAPLTPADVKANDASYRQVEEPIVKAMRLVFMNQFREAEEALGGAEEKAEARAHKYPLEPDLRCFVHMMKATVFFLRGALSLENKQLDEGYKRMVEGEKLSELGPKWPGKEIMKCTSLVGQAAVLIVRKSYAQGAWIAVRSLKYLKELHSGLDYKGRERVLVRSLSLWTNANCNIIISKLPPFLVKAAAWVAGVSGDREEGVKNMITLWEDDQFLAPAAASSLISLYLDPENLGIRPSEKEWKLVQDIQRWAEERYPGSMFFVDHQAQYKAQQRDLRAAYDLTEKVLPLAAGYPAIGFGSHVRLTQYALAMLNFDLALEHTMKAIEVQQSVQRRSHIPTLAAGAAIMNCVNGNEAGAQDMVELVRQCQKADKKNWETEDAAAFELVKGFPYRVPGPDGGLPKLVGKMTCEPAKHALDRLVIHQHLVRFMTPECVDKVVVMTTNHRDAESPCSDTRRCWAHAILGGIWSQAGSPAKALEECKSGIALRPRLDEVGTKEGYIPFLVYVQASALVDQGDIRGAKEAVRSFLALGKNHDLYMWTSARIAEISRHIGEHVQDHFTELIVKAGQKKEVLLAVPSALPTEGDISWEAVTPTNDISFVVLFMRDVPDGAAVWEELQREESVERGCGSFVPSGPGTLKLIFDNTSSWFKNKTVLLQVEPKLMESARREGDCGL